MGFLAYLASKKAISFIRLYFKAAKRKLAVVGISGGLDSAATLALCVRALGRENVVAVLLPSSSTPKEDVADARALARQFKVEKIEFPIDGVLASFGRFSKGRLIRANLSSRIRMAILYSIANSRNGLVVGSSDKSELLLGYFTKYGDGAADLFPLGGFYKTQVRQIAIHLGVPRKIAFKPPSPALWKGQTAQKELGFSYEAADPILQDIEKGKSQAFLARKYGKRLVKRILSMIGKNRHKQLPAPICL